MGFLNIQQPAGGSSGGTAVQLPGANDFRLTLQSGVAVPTTDQTGKTTIYLTPYLSNRIWLYNGSTAWAQLSSAEVSLALGTKVNAQAYDVFAYNNSGTLTLEDVEWSNATVTVTIATPAVMTWTGHGLLTGDSITLTTSGALPTGLTANTQYFITKIDANTFNLSTSLINVAAATKIATTGSQSGTQTGHSPRNRQTALATQDGVYVQSGATNKLYVGSYMTSSTTTTEDSFGGASQAGGKRFLFNAYNAVPRNIGVIDTTDSWTYTTATYRQADNAAGNKVECFVGLATNLVAARVYGHAINAGAVVTVAVGIGVDSTSATSALTRGETTVASPTAPGLGCHARYSGYPGIGYHSLSWLEISAASGTTTWYGDNGNANVQSGLEAEVWA